MLIVCEGIDFSGKTSHSKRVAAELGAHWMCFPNRTTPYGKIIDSWLKGEWAISDKYLEAMLFQAAQIANRSECFGELAARLGAGEIVVCDRYWPSSVVYAELDGIFGARFEDIQQWMPQAAVCILMDIPVSVALERMHGRSLDRYESDSTRLARASAIYREMWALKSLSHPRNGIWLTIDSAREKEVVHQDIMDKLRAAIVRGRSLVGPDFGKT